MLNRKHVMKQRVIQLSLEGYTIPDIHIELQESGITKKNGSAYSKRAISGVLQTARQEWADSMATDRNELLAQQHAEIQHVKKVLHEDGDYKTLVRYLEMENKLLTPKVSAQHINTQNNLFVSAAERIQALQLARESEAFIMEQNKLDAERIRGNAEDGEYEVEMEYVGEYEVEPETVEGAYV